MAHDHRLAVQRIGREARKAPGDLSHVFDRGELTVHSAAQHDILDHLFHGDARSIACSAICFSTNGVMTKPGQITFVRATQATVHKPRLFVICKNHPPSASRFRPIKRGIRTI